MSEFFSNAHNFSINGGTFSGVNGDQHNHYYERTVQASHLSTSRSGLIAQGTSSRAITTTIHINGNQINNQIVEREEKELTEFDDFRNLKRGDICRLWNICQVFEEEFHKLSRQLFSEAAQVYAIDKGTIPSMVFWHNLVPLAQVLSNVGELVQGYLQSLHAQWNCDHDEMWIDPTRGVVCRGPKGPHSIILKPHWKIKDLPPTAELLQEEVLVRFLGNQKSREADDEFMYVMSYARSYENVPERVDRPTIFSALTKTPIAVANNVWEGDKDNLVERTCLGNGWTR
ncbi:hypothetical protein PQX77_006800 [Marasmius sp. AFHP31]|nr:hypothetical protein PQX77_006800 [Marasmius sp. AFHP31]